MNSTIFSCFSRAFWRCTIICCSPTDSIERNIFMGEAMRISNFSNLNIASPEEYIEKELNNESYETKSIFVKTDAFWTWVHLNLTRSYLQVSAECNVVMCFCRYYFIRNGIDYYITSPENKLSHCAHYEFSCEA